MKYCPQCGAALQDNSKFCTNCGQPVTVVGTDSPTKSQTYYMQNSSQPKQHNTIRSIFMVIGIIAVVIWVYNSFFAVDYEKEYKNGSIYYNNRDYEKAKECFSRIDEEYQSTKLYLILCDAHLQHNLTDDQVKELKRNLDFNDAKAVLVSETPIAEKFLLGYWHTENKSRTLEMYEKEDYYHIETNLAPSGHWDEAESFYITDGVFGLYMPKGSAEGDAKTNIIEKYRNIEPHETRDYNDREDLFRISVLERDKIAVVNLKDSSRYILIRD